MYVCVSDGGRRAGGIYVWASRADADRLYGGEWRAMVEAQFGGPPTVHFLTLPGVVTKRQRAVRHLAGDDRQPARDGHRAVAPEWSVVDVVSTGVERQRCWHRQLMLTAF